MFLTKSKLSSLGLATALLALAPSVLAASTAVRGTAQGVQAGTLFFSNAASSVAISQDSCGVNSFSGKAYSDTLGLVDFSTLTANYVNGGSRASIKGVVITPSAGKIYFDTMGGSVSLSVPGGSFSGKAFSPTLGFIDFAGVTSSWTPNCSNPLPKVDIKVNGSDGPINALPGSQVNITWSSSDIGVSSCVASGAWSGQVTPSSSAGGETVALVGSNPTFTLSCGSVSDSVTVNTTGTSVPPTEPPPGPVPPTGSSSIPQGQCPYPMITQDLQYGSKGDQVYALQAYLYQFKEKIPELGYGSRTPTSVILGSYGGVTRRAVTAFQTKYGLTANGIVGADLRAAISASCIPTRTLTQATCPLPALTLDLRRSKTDRSTGYQVTALQKYLYGFKDQPMLGLSSVGESDFVGSGNFGNLTFRALSAFQATYGISVPTGVLNEATRNAIVAHCTPPPAPPKVSCADPLITKDLSSGYRQNRDLHTGGQVSALQAFLYQYKDIYNWGLSTTARENIVAGNYGSKTTDLVKRFQAWFGVVSPTDPEYGKVFAATRNAISSQCDSALPPVIGLPVVPPTTPPVPTPPTPPTPPTTPPVTPPTTPPVTPPTTPPTPPTSQQYGGVLGIVFNKNNNTQGVPTTLVLTKPDGTTVTKNAQRSASDPTYLFDGLSVPGTYYVRPNTYSGYSNVVEYCLATQANVNTLCSSTGSGWQTLNLAIISVRARIDLTSSAPEMRLWWRFTPTSVTTTQTKGNIQGLTFENTSTKPGVGAQVSMAGVGSVNTGGLGYQFHFNNIDSGSQTVTAQIPSGFTSAEWSVCPAGQTGTCHGVWNKGSTATVNVVAGNFVDLWFRFNPAPTPPTSTTGTVEGYIFDKATSAGVPSVISFLSGSTLKTTTNQNVMYFYSSDPLPVGSVKVSVNIPAGYVFAESCLSQVTTDNHFSSTCQANTGWTSGNSRQVQIYGGAGNAVRLRWRFSR